MRRRSETKTNTKAPTETQEKHKTLDHSKKRGNLFRKTRSSQNLSSTKEIKPKSPRGKLPINLAATETSERITGSSNLSTATIQAQETPSITEKKEGFRNRKTGRSLPSLWKFFHQGTESGAISPRRKSDRNDGKVESDAENKKPDLSYTNSSVRLFSLINEEVNAELYRSTLAWKQLANKNLIKIKELMNFPWYTAQSLLTLFDTQLRQQLIEIQLEQINLLHQLCDDILDPAFQQYLRQTKDEAKQAAALCTHLRDCIAVVMHNDLSAQYPPLAALHFREGIIERMFQEKCEKLAALQVQCWHILDEVEFDKKLNVIFPYLCSHINKSEYNSILAKLLEATIKVGTSSYQLMQNITAIGIGLENRKVPEGYIALSECLNMDELSQTAVIKNLALAFNDEGLSNHFPRCFANEADFYFLEESSLLARIKDLVPKQPESSEKEVESILPSYPESFTTELASELIHVLLPSKQEEYHSISL